jgi:hypothetical protein
MAQTVAERWRDGGGRRRRNASRRMSTRAMGGGAEWLGSEAPLFIGVRRNWGGGCQG